MTFFVRDQNTIDIQHNAEDLERLSDGISLEGKNLLDLHVNSLTVVNETKMEDDQIIDGDLFVTGKIQCDKNINSEQSIVAKNILSTVQIISDGMLKVTGDSSLADVTTSGDSIVQNSLEISGPDGINVQSGSCTLTGDINVLGNGTFESISTTGNGAFGAATVDGRAISTTVFAIARVNKVRSYTVISGIDTPDNPNWIEGVVYLQEVNLPSPIEIGTNINYAVHCTGPNTAAPNCVVQNIVGGNTDGTKLVSVNVLFYCILFATGSFDQYIAITYNK